MYATSLPNAQSAQLMRTADWSTRTVARSCMSDAPARTSTRSSPLLVRFHSISTSDRGPSNTDIGSGDDPYQTEMNHFIDTVCALSSMSAIDGNTADDLDPD